MRFSGRSRVHRDVGPIVPSELHTSWESHLHMQTHEDAQAPRSLCASPSIRKPAESTESNAKKNHKTLVLKNNKVRMCEQQQQPNDV